MKKVIFVLAMIAVMFAGCSNNEKKAQKLINHQLKVTLHDFGSYESVEFGEIDSAYSSITDMPEFIIASEKFDRFKKQSKELQEDAKRYFEFSLNDKAKECVELAKQSADSLMYYANVIKNIEFEPEFVGWSITHTFRANNAGGNKVIAHRKYYFDKDITEIVKNENLDEK